MFTAVFTLLIQEKVIVKTYKVSSSKWSVRFSPLTSSRLWDEDDGDEHDSSPAESELKRCPPPHLDSGAPAVSQLNERAPYLLEAPLIVSRSVFVFVLFVFQHLKKKDGEGICILLFKGNSPDTQLQRASPSKPVAIVTLDPE